MIVGTTINFTKFTNVFAIKIVIYAIHSLIPIRLVWKVNFINFNFVELGIKNIDFDY